MNAFPPELLQHHFACMLVTGLTSPISKSVTPPTTAAAAAAASAPPTTEASETTAPPDHPTKVFPDLTKSLHDILSARARNALWDPARGRSAVFHTIFADHNVRLPPLKTKPSPRHVAPIPSITCGSASTPPSEASTSAFAALPPRSPLSPLHPNSPQFPDGLIAPVWVRKHRELVPSVFVAFHTLPTNQDIEEVRKADQDLIKIIAERRRTLTERGIKLTVVLLTQREMLDDAQLEVRLSSIRRSSGLDSRASLFVLTPVTKSELGEFVASLHSALYDCAVDYYREHARRVKRKRTRYPPPPSTLQPIVTALGTLPPSSSNAKPVNVSDISWLSREGWIIRSEYKLALFAELSGDIPEALLRYREAYDLLCTTRTCLLGSTLMLPPRTKRWAEAKVLADTLNIRICKLMLYQDSGEGAAMFFRKHLSRFTELSTGWGIGSMTFEYWSWLSKQYRMFGELIEAATRPIQGSPLPAFQLPTHAPPLPSKLLHPDTLSRYSDGRGGVEAPSGMLLPNSNAVSVCIAPYNTLQTPGTYFHLAALCTVERRARFLRAISASSISSSDEEFEGSPLAHERKVDHTAQLTEMLTKAYDAFKRNRLHRSALMVASRIATAYYDGGQMKMALKFLERIVRSYGKDEVEEVRASLVEVAIAAAIGAGDKRSAARMLMEVMDPKLPMDREKRQGLVGGLKTFLSQNAGTPDGQVKRDDAANDNIKGAEESRNSPITSVVANFVEVVPVFPASEVDFGSSVPFQLVLRNTAQISLLDIFSVSRLTFTLTTGQDSSETIISITSNNAIQASESSGPVIVQVGMLDPTSPTPPEPQSANLSEAFLTEGLIACQGSLKASQEGSVRVSKATLHAVQLSDGLEVELDLPLAPFGASLSEPSLKTGHWLLSSGKNLAVTQRLDPSVTLVRPQRFDVDVVATAPAVGGYVDERIPIRVDVHNKENKAVQVWMYATLQPSYDGARDTLCCSEEEGKEEVGGQSVKGVCIGEIGAGDKAEKVIWLTSRQAAGVRTVNVSVRVMTDREGEEVNMEALPVAASASVAVPVGLLFFAKSWSQRVGREQRKKKQGGVKGLLDLDSDSELEECEEGKSDIVRVGLDVEMVGETVIEVTSVDPIR
nr:conserved hypothetical protein [Melanopsichium pennsylvanicum 4]